MRIACACSGDGREDYAGEAEGEAGVEEGRAAEEGAGGVKPRRRRSGRCTASFLREVRR